MRKHIGTGAIVLLLSGCVQFQIGHNFDLQQVKSSIQYGVTTQAQISNLLGSPDSVGVVVDTSGNQYTRWTYFYGRGKLTSVHSTTIKTLEIQFDNQGIVRAYNWTGE